MDEALFKSVHVTAAVLSICGFAARGLAALRGAAWLRSRLARTLPHVVDAILLISGVALAWRLGATPASAPWLLAKICGLAVYIALGMVALRRGIPSAVRATAWVAALATAGWIVSVAVTKSPLGFLAALR